MSSKLKEKKHVLEIMKSSNHPNHQSIWKSSNHPNHQIIKSTFFPTPIFTSSAGSKQVGSSLQHHGRQPADSRRNLPATQLIDQLQTLSTFLLYLIRWYQWLVQTLFIWYVDTSYYLYNVCLLVSWYVPLWKSKVKECAKKGVQSSSPPSIKVATTE